jgi:hypothetical protein
MKLIFKLNKMISLIFEKIRFWTPLQSEGRQKLTEKADWPQNGGKTTAMDFYEYADAYRTIVLIKMFEYLRICARGGTVCPPPHPF